MEISSNKPLVTVHICTYNRADKIAKAIDSVLAQTYTNLQILIMDDASTDETSAVVRKYLENDSRIEYYSNENNLGITKNRNRALSLSKGQYIAVLDSDDYWIDENKIEDQVNFLESNPEHAAVGTFTKFVDETDSELFIFKPKTTDTEIRKNILIQNQIVHSSVMFRKNSLKLYSEKYDIWEDLVAWLEIGQNNKLANLPITATAYTKHSGNISNSKKLQNAHTLDEIISDYKTYPNYYKAKLKNHLRIIKAIFNR